MKDFNKKVKENIDLQLMLLYLLSLPLYHFLNRPIGQPRSLALSLDQMIPLIPGFIVIYASWMPFLLFYLSFFYRKDREVFRRMISHLLIGQWAGYLTFVLFSTEVPRAMGLESAFFERLLTLTYALDGPYAAFPSLHSLGCFVLIFHLWSAKLSRKIRLFGVFYALMIILSTLVIKQHVILDVALALVYTGLLYQPSLFFLRWMLSKK